MSTTQDQTPGAADMEARLRAALDARAELVRPEDLAPIAPVVPLRPKWQSPWVLLATAAVVLLVLGAVFQGVTGGPKSDEIAPQPDEPTIEPTPDVPVDIGRDWSPDPQSTPTRIDLDGDGKPERVEFLAEPTGERGGRTRVQTTLTSTGDEAYGLVELGSTVGINAMEPVDADGDGDQELVLYSTDYQGKSFAPAVLDLRDGLLEQAVPSDPDLLAGGEVAVPGSATEYYEMIHRQSYFVDAGSLVSTRSVDTYATPLRVEDELFFPETLIVDRYEWRLDDDGVLRPGEPTCAYYEPEAQAAPCTPDIQPDLPYVTSESTATVSVGEQVALEDGGLGYSARLEAGDPPTLVVDGPNADGDVFAVDVPDPVVSTLSPTDLRTGQGASVLIRSASDPNAMQVVVQPADQVGLMALRPVGDVPLGTGTADDGSDYRSWLTGAGLLVTVVANDDGSWEAWRWARVGDQEIAALPWGTICFDDVEDPTTGKAC